MAFVQFWKSTGLLELLDALDVRDGQPINDASVTLVAVKDAQGAVVAGQVFPTPLAYVASSAGHYRATLSHQLAVQVGQEYEAEIDFDGGPERRRYWFLPFLVLKSTK